jgi:hypothetical protein
MRMDRSKIANLLIGATAVMLVVTGVLHSAAYGQVSRMAGSVGSADVQALLPLLWTVFGIDLIGLGVVVAVVGLENSNGGRWVLFASAICPIGAAIGQMVFLGFEPPTALLLLNGALAIAAGTMREPRRRRAMSK